MVSQYMLSQRKHEINTSDEHMYALALQRATSDEQRNPMTHIAASIQQRSLHFSAFHVKTPGQIVTPYLNNIMHFKSNFSH